MGNRVITFIKDDDSNVINVQQFLLRDEFEHYKRELREKKLEKKRKLWWVVATIIVATILTYLTIHKISPLQISNNGSQVNSVIFAETGFSILASVVVPVHPPGSRKEIYG
jgi:hypothetical protein